MLIMPEWLIGLHVVVLLVAGTVLTILISKGKSWLSFLIAIAMVMGPGPGLYLINPDPGDPDTVRVALGMPIVYVWAVGWFFVQLAVVLIAYFKVWARDES